MPETTWGLPYPDSTDAPNIPADIQALADAVNAALNLPDSVSNGNSSGNTITSTSYAALPTNACQVAFTNPSADYDLEVDVTVSAWMASNGTVELTCTFAMTGGITMAAGTTGGAGAVSTGEVLLAVDTTAASKQSTIPVVIPAGAAAVTFAVQAKRSSASGTQLVNFPTIRVKPRRWLLP